MDIVIRAAIMFLFIWLLTRAVGRRELSTLEPFDLILLVVIGDLAQQGITQSDYSFTGLVLSLGTFGLLTVLLSYLVYRIRALRPVLEGRPLILIENGEFVERNMRRERITPEEVAAAARQEIQCDDLKKVRWAVLESNGRISFIER